MFGTGSSNRIWTNTLEPIVIAHLNRAHMLLRMVGKANENFDPTCERCSAIEPTERTGCGNVFDALIDAARSVMEFLLTANPSVAAALIERYFATKIRALVRLAVHGIRKSPTITADEKLRWLQTHALLFSVAGETEVFTLLRSAYPDASPGHRLEMLDAIGAGPCCSRVRANSHRSVSPARSMS